MAIPPRRTLLVEMRLEQAQANYVRKVLGDSANAIEERLAKVGTSGNPLTRMQMEAQRSAIKAVLDEDFKNIHESIASGKTAAAKAASGVVSQYENQLLKAVMNQDAMRRIARSEAQRTVNNLEAALKRVSGTSYKPLSQQVYKTKQLASGWVDDIVNRGLLSGWSAKQLSDAIIPSISPNVAGGVSYAANRLARTEINNAYHAASYDRYLKSTIVEEVEWLLSSSHPEDDVCNDYASESPFKKNAVPAKPHPNCYCYIMPRLPTEEEFLDRLFAGEYGDEPWAADVDIAKMDLPDMVTSRSTDPTYRGPSPKRNEYIVEHYVDQMRMEYLEYSNDKMASLAMYDRIDKSEAIRRINETLQSTVNSGKMAMQVRSQDIDSILSSGFKSGFDTKTGAGGANARYYESRDLIERVNFGSRVEEVRPLYGFLDSDAVRTGAAKNYGDVKVVFKDDVRESTSVSWGDSLNSKAIRPAPANRMDWYAVDPDLGAYRDVLSGAVSQAQTAGYVELQFHKALTAADIQSIAFPVQPGVELIARLKALDIDWSVVSP